MPRQRRAGTNAARQPSRLRKVYLYWTTLLPLNLTMPQGVMLMLCALAIVIMSIEAKSILQLIKLMNQVWTMLLDVLQQQNITHLNIERDGESKFYFVTRNGKGPRY